MELTGEEQATLASQAIISQEQTDRYNESQKTSEDRLAEAVEGYNPDGTPIEQTNEPILGKFKSQEDLVKAYQELEKKMGQGKEAVEAPTEEEETKTVEAPDGKTIDVSKFDQEFVDNGELSEASYQELKEVGFTKGDVDKYIQGQQALSTQNNRVIHDSVGGAEAYTELVTWASDNIEQSIIDEYNTTLSTGNTAKVTQMLEYMSLKRGASQPTTPIRLTATSDSGGGMKAFSNKGEWQKATSNNLYGKDEKYTNMIDKRYLASKRNGSI